MPIPFTNAAKRGEPVTALRDFGEGEYDGVRPREDLAARQDELHGATEVLLRDFRKPARDLLVRRVVEPLAGDAPPPLDPEPAESAVPVEDEKRPVRRVRDATRCGSLHARESLRLRRL